MGRHCPSSWSLHFLQSPVPGSHGIHEKDRRCAMESRPPIQGAQVQARGRQPSRCPDCERSYRRSLVPVLSFSLWKWQGKGVPASRQQTAPLPNWHKTPQGVFTLAQTAFTSKPILSVKGQDHANQSATLPPQTETRTKENPNRLEWKVPTLADLLQRLSVSSANPSLKR
jgi:hypothetical protein